MNKTNYHRIMTSYRPYEIKQTIRYLLQCYGMCGITTDEFEYTLHCVAIPKAPRILKHAVPNAV